MEQTHAHHGAVKRSRANINPQRHAALNLLPPARTYTATHRPCKGHFTFKSRHDAGGPYSRGKSLTRVWASQLGFDELKEEENSQSWEGLKGHLKIVG